MLMRVVRLVSGGGSLIRVFVSNGVNVGRVGFAILWGV